MTPVLNAQARRDLKLTRLYYFIYFGGLGFIAPFLNLFYARLGFSGMQIGWITAAGSVAALVAAPLWTSRSNQWRNPRGMLQVSLILGATGYLALLWQEMFFGVLVITVFRTLVLAGVWPLSDSLALSVTGAVHKGFGSVRVWTSMGWIVAVLLSGWLIEQTSVRAGLVGASVSALLGALVLFPINAHNFHPSHTTEQQHLRLHQVIRLVLRDRAMVSVALMMVIIGIMNSGVAQFETVYLDTLGASETVIGIASMVGAVIEVPCMLWTDRLLARRSAHHLLLISMLMSAGLRAMVLLVPAVPTIILERAMAGVSFSFYVIALLRFISERTAPAQTRTVHALYNVTLASLIAIVASPLAGALYDQVGARWLYAAAAAGYLLAWGVLRLAQEDSGSTP